MAAPFAFRQNFAAHYLVGKALNRGGNAIVFDCYRAGENPATAVADLVVKYLSESRTPRIASAAGQDRLRKECETWQGIDHPHIVRLHEAFCERSVAAGQGSAKTRAYLIMERSPMGGRDLVEVLEHRGKLSQVASAIILYQLCDAVHALHTAPTPVIHRDIKPDNILCWAEQALADGKPVLTVKLADFGEARFLEPMELAMTLDIGTHEFRAPEIGNGHGHTAAVDIYSLGATVYALLCGQFPHGRRPERRIRTKVVQGGKEVEVEVDNPHFLSQFSSWAAIQSQGIDSIDLSAPAHAHLSAAAKDLLRQTMSPRPEERPSAAQLTHHPFFAEARALGIIGEPFPLSVAGASTTEGHGHAGAAAMDGE